LQQAAHGHQGGNENCKGYEKEATIIESFGDPEA